MKWHTTCECRKTAELISGHKRYSFFSRSLTLPQSNFACQQGKMSSSTPSKPKSSTPSKPKSSTPSKPTPVTLTLRQKAEVLKEQEKGLSCRKLAVKFGVGKTQIGEIFKRKREILDALENNAAPDAKRLKTNQHYEEINKLTYEWYLDAIRTFLQVSILQF